MWTGNADRAALVGHGPGDGLANPPGGIGAELEAAAVFELVDRPHQAGVAFLDQVQEAQAAVAVLLGDRDDQPQVAFRQAALGLLILGVDLLQIRHAVAQAGGRFLRGPQDIAIFGDPGLALLAAALAVGVVGVVLANALAELVDPAAEFLEGLDHRLDPLRAQAEFLDQPHGAAAAAARAVARPRGAGPRSATCWWRCCSRAGSASAAFPACADCAAAGREFGAFPIDRSPKPAPCDRTATRRHARGAAP